MKTPRRAHHAVCALALLAVARAAAPADRIPITTSSEEARQLYLEGRDLVEKLRATDARALFQQAAAKDPGFALAQVGLANSAGTAKEFFDAVARAVSLADKASEPEKLLVCALDAGAKGEPSRQKDCLTRLVAACPDDERAHNQMGAYHFGRQEYAEAIAESQQWGALTGNKLEATVALAQCQAAAGNRELAMNLIEHVDPDGMPGGILHRGIALVYASLGERDQAFTWLAKAEERRAKSLCNIKIDPKLDGLREDPRFGELLRRVGLEK